MNSFSPPSIKFSHTLLAGLRLHSGISKGWFYQITDSATFEASGLIAVPKMAESCPEATYSRLT